MLDNMLIAAGQVGILYLMALVGFIADKAGVFKEKTAKECTDVLLSIITPAKILDSFFTLEYTTAHLKGLFIAIGCGLIIHGLAALGAIPLFRKCGSDQAVVYRYGCIYGNCGYMGLPLVDAMVGSEGVFYCAAFVIAFQIFTFTHGIWLMNVGKETGKAKIDLKKIILNPGVIPVIIGLPVFILSGKYNFEIPSFITTPVSSIGSMLSPLAMLIFGTYIAHTDFRSVFRDKNIWLVNFFKLFLMPAVMIAAAKLTGIGGALGTTLIIACATPSANNTTMFPAKYDRDAYLGSRIVAVSSIISIVTLPVMIAAGGKFV